MPQVAVAGGGAHFGADHAMRRIAHLVEVVRLNGPGEARPATSRLVLVGRGEEGLARYDIDVDARLLVMEVFARAGTLGAILLRHAVLLWRKPRNGFCGLAIVAHRHLL